MNLTEREQKILKVLDAQTEWRSARRIWALTEKRPGQPVSGSYVGGMAQTLDRMSRYEWVTSAYRTGLRGRVWRITEQGRKVIER